MSRTVSLPDELYERLSQAAEAQGLDVPALLERWIAAGPDRAPESEGGGQDELLVQCTRALLNGEEPPIPVDWGELERVLSSTEPACSTLEEAMTALRHRPWTGDSPQC